MGPERVLKGLVEASRARLREGVVAFVFSLESGFVLFFQAVELHLLLLHDLRQL